MRYMYLMILAALFAATPSTAFAQACLDDARAAGFTDCPDPGHSNIGFRVICPACDADTAVTLEVVNASGTTVASRNGRFPISVKAANVPSGMYDAILVWDDGESIPIMTIDGHNQTSTRKTKTLRVAGRDAGDSEANWEPEEPDRRDHTHTRIPDPDPSDSAVSPDRVTTRDHAVTGESDDRRDDTPAGHTGADNPEFYSVQETATGMKVSLDGAAKKGSDSNFIEEWIPALREVAEYLDAHPYACVEVHGAEDESPYDRRAANPAETDEWWLGDEETHRFTRALSRRTRIQLELETIAASYDNVLSLQIRTGEVLLRSPIRGGQLVVRDECIERPDLAEPVVIPGISCWDLNENGIKDFPEEDVNNDTEINVKDCTETKIKTVVERGPVGLASFSLGPGFVIHTLRGFLVIGNSNDNALYPAGRVEVMFDEQTHVFRWGGFLEFGPAVRSGLPGELTDMNQDGHVDVSDNRVLPALGGGLRIGFDCFPQSRFSFQIDMSPVALTSGGWTRQNKVVDHMWGFHLTPTARLFDRVRIGLDIRLAYPSKEDLANPEYQYQTGFGGFILVDLVSWKDLD